MASASSSYIKTTTAVDTRTRDQLSFPLLARPQAMTLYVRFIELGSILVASMRLLAIDEASSATPRLFLWAQTQYQLRHDTNYGTVTATMAAAPALGDRVELCGQLAANGSVTLIQSLNGAAASQSATSAALTLAPAWSDDVLWLNSVGTNGVGFCAFRNVLIVRGVQSLATCRRLAGTD